MIDYMLSKALGSKKRKSNENIQIDGLLLRNENLFSKSPVVGVYYSAHPAPLPSSRKSPFNPRAPVGL